VHRENATARLANPEFEDKRLLESLTRTFTLSSGVSFEVKFSPVARHAVDSVMKRVYGDGLALSKRVWNLNESTRKGIEDKLLVALHTGQSARDLAKDLKGYLVDEGADNAHYRAMRLARTEINNAYREGHLQAAVDPSTGQLWSWISGIRWSLSSSHTERDLCDIYASDDGDGLGAGVYLPATTPIGHAHCFPAGTSVRSPGTTAATKRWFRGEMTEILTASGNLLTGTNNHPVLTPQGWVPLGLLNEGSYVISSRRREGPIPDTDPDCYDAPALIEDVAEALLGAPGVGTRTVPVSPEDFHGDGAGSEVCVIGSYGGLRIGPDAALHEPLPKDHFVLAEVQRVGLPGEGQFAEMLKTLGLPTDSRLSSHGSRPVAFRRPGSQIQSDGFSDPPDGDFGSLESQQNSRPGNAALGSKRFLGLASEIASDDLLVRHGQFRPPEPPVFETASDGSVGPDQESADHVTADSTLFGQGGHRGAAQVTLPDFIDRERDGSPIAFGAAADRDVSGFQYPMDRAAGDAQFQSDLGDRFPGEVAFSDLVVRVRKFNGFAGHVYNLQTAAGLYIANGIIVHNCMCWLADVLVSYPAVGVSPVKPDVSGVPDSLLERYAEQDDGPAQRALEARRGS
jgi:hypothetical protein